MYALLILAVLGVLILAYSHIKNLFFTAKDAKLTKEGEQLAKDADALKANINVLKQGLDIPQNKMSPEEVENYWSKK